MHKSTKWLIGMIGLIVLMPLLSTMLPQVDPSEETSILHFYLALHILGVVLFLGNIIVTGIWMYLAEKTKNISVINFSVKAVNWMDVFFTAPGVALILLTGFLQAPHFGGIYSQSWMVMGITLFSLSGLIWIIFLIPDQNRLIKISEGVDVEKRKLPKSFFKILHRWYLWGIIAIILPLITVLDMALKPKFW